MLVLTRKNRESVVIGRPEDLQVVLEITILEIEGGRVRLGFEADTRMPIHRREVWDRICNGDAGPNGNGNGNGQAAARLRPATVDGEVEVEIEVGRRRR
jgi:carbon storage regulator CsrA